MTDLFAKHVLRDLTLQNRIVMAPMTRSRAPAGIATELMALYYTQRATAGLIISEGAPISSEGQGYLFTPGLHSKAQIEGWRLTTNSVHAIGAKIFAQLWHVGRVSHVSLQPDGNAPVSSTSKIAGGSTAFAYNDKGEAAPVPASPPRALTTSEVKRVIEDFATAASNALEAGFDGVELHGANGYLIEQFINPLVNDRSDQYSGSPDNRLRFVLETVDAIIARIGAERVGVRLSPYGQLSDMPAYQDTLETYVRLAQELSRRKIAYVHIMDQSNYFEAEPVEGCDASARLEELLTSLRGVLGDTCLILAGAMTKKRAQTLIERNLIDLVAFGEPFISNPDLVERLQVDAPLNPSDRTTYYGGDAKGYVDYPALTQR